jgi:hypothetical protein
MRHSSPKCLRAGWRPGGGGVQATGYAVQLYQNNTFSRPCTHRIARGMNLKKLALLFNIAAILKTQHYLIITLGKPFLSRLRVRQKYFSVHGECA